MFTRCIALASIDRLDTDMNPKSEIRIPEIRKKSEIQISKTTSRHEAGSFHNLQARMLALRDVARASSPARGIAAASSRQSKRKQRPETCFATSAVPQIIRPSVFGFLSDFGFRTSDFNWNSKFAFSMLKKIPVILFSICSLAAWAEKPVYQASFADFDRRARSTKPVSVVFFGGSLTSGDGASDPERTSFRALMEKYLREQYPSARFNFFNAGRGGSGSKLGMFRTGSDVLSHKPDLVFLDFTTEDNLGGTDRQALASYERILRDLISEGIPVVQVLTGTKNYFGAAWKPLGPTRWRDHFQMGTLYHTAIGNSFPRIQNFLNNERHAVDQIWPKDETQPNDLGHQFFFEAARDGLEQAIREKRLCNFPVNAVFADEYRMRFQFFPANGPLPTGWHAENPLRASLSPSDISFDALNQIAVSDGEETAEAQPLRLTFTGTFVGISGEANEHGLGFKVSIDGKTVFYDDETDDEVWPTSMTRESGEAHFFWHEISDKLSAGRHTLEIRPARSDRGEKGELRIESFCVAGPAADAPQSISARASGL